MELYALPTWYDRHNGGVVVVEDDVQNIVRRVKEIDPRIHVFFNEQSQGFDLVEYCLDGNQRLVFSVKELDARVIPRLLKSDTWLGGNPSHTVSDDQDFLTEMEREQEIEQDAIQEQSLEKIRDAGERLAWALDVAGVGYHDSIHIKKEIS